MGVASIPDEVGSIWRTIAIPRFVTLAFAVVVNLLNWREYGHPIWVWGLVTVIAIWTLFSTWAFDSPERRWRWLLLVDLALAVGALAAGRFVLGAQLLEQGTTIPGFWVVSPVLAWSVQYSWYGGIVAAAVVGAADLGFRTHISAENISNVFLTFVVGVAVGAVTTLVRNAAAERARHAEFVARTAERERLARVVHDGVLQVLSYVQRRGSEIGGETADLASAAGEQEALLRALVQTEPVDPGRRDIVQDNSDEQDLTSRLRGLGGQGISVATPADPVLLPAEDAEELVAAVRAALDNVRRHAPHASTFVLLEEEPGEVVVSIRDDGPGIPDGRLAAAEAAGRMGVSRSIVGRVGDLGGSAVLSSTPGNGTEWELRIPRKENLD